MRCRRPPLLLAVQQQAAPSGDQLLRGAASHCSALLVCIRDEAAAWQLWPGSYASPCTSKCQLPDTWQAVTAHKA